MRFRYEGVDAGGNAASGHLEAASEREASRQLAAQASPWSPCASSANVGSGCATARAPRPANCNWCCRIRDAARRRRVAGDGAVVAGEIQPPSRAHRGFRRDGACRAPRRELQRGVPCVGPADPGYFHQLVQAGEATGRLAESLRAGVEQFEYDQRVAAEFRAALVYPSVLVGSGIAAVGIIFLWVVPRFGGLLTQHGEQMPALSRWTITTGVWLSKTPGWCCSRSSRWRWARERSGASRDSATGWRSVRRACRYSANGWSKPKSGAGPVRWRRCSTAASS